jgi:hypothetical protein
VVVSWEATSSGSGTLNDLPFTDRNDALLSPQDLAVSIAGANEVHRRTSGRSRSTSTDHLGIAQAVQVSLASKPSKPTSIVSGAVENLLLNLGHRLSHVGECLDPHHVFQATLISGRGCDVNGERSIEHLEVQRHAGLGALLVFDPIIDITESNRWVGGDLAVLERVAKHGSRCEHAQEWCIVKDIANKDVHVGFVEMRHIGRRQVAISHNSKSPFWLRW